jgi:hypothetical protein
MGIKKAAVRDAGSNTILSMPDARCPMPDAPCPMPDAPFPTNSLKPFPNPKVDSAVAIVVDAVVNANRS